MVRRWTASRPVICGLLPPRVAGSFFVSLQKRGGAGDFHLPRPKAIRIAGDVIRAFEKTHPGMEIFLVLYNKSIYEMAVKILAQTEENDHGHESVR